MLKEILQAEEGPRYKYGEMNLHKRTKSSEIVTT